MTVTTDGPLQYLTLCKASKETLLTIGTFKIHKIISVNYGKINNRICFKVRKKRLMTKKHKYQYLLFKSRLKCGLERKESVNNELEKDS